MHSSSSGTYSIAAATPTERALATTAQNAGWPADDVRTRYGSGEDGPYVLVSTVSGVARLQAADGSFRVVSYMSHGAGGTVDENALPDDVKAAGLSYPEFLKLAATHDLNAIIVQD